MKGNIKKMLMGTLFVTALSLGTSCEKLEPIEEVSCYNFNQQDCKYDTTIYPVIVSNGPSCLHSTVINIANFSVDKDSINLGEEIMCTYDALSPNACAASSVIITRAIHNKQIELHTHLQLDTCNGCYKSLVPTLIPVPVSYTWKPLEKGTYTLKFINIYGSDIKKEIHVK
jgi:hypothetical protein